MCAAQEGVSCHSRYARYPSLLSSFLENLGIRGIAPRGEPRCVGMVVASLNPRAWAVGGATVQYSGKFKDAVVRRMVVPSAVSAGALSREVEVAQSTLSTWLRDGLGRESDQVDKTSARAARHAPAT